MNDQYFTNSKAPTLVATYDSSIDTSTEITLNSGSSILEVSAITSGIFLAWGTDDASTSNFDEYISPNTTRLYVIPDDTSAVNFLQASANGILVCIEK